MSIFLDGKPLEDYATSRIPMFPAYLKEIITRNLESGGLQPQRGDAELVLYIISQENPDVELTRHAVLERNTTPEWLHGEAKRMRDDALKNLELKQKLTCAAAVRKMLNGRLERREEDGEA